MDEKCFNHEEKNSIGICTSCGRSFCGECLTHYNDQFFCNSDGCKLALQIYKNNNPEIKKEENKVYIFPSLLKRFINALLDFICIRMIATVIFQGLNYQEKIELFMRTQDMSIVFPYLFLKIIGIYAVVFFLYYFIFELLFQRSPAKFFTNTIVIHNTGQKPGLKNVFIRTLLRCTLIDVMSYKKGTLWHDRLSSTFVVIDFTRRYKSNSD